MNERIFISHSDREQETVNFLKCLSDELKNEFEVYVDTELQKKPGCDWRQELFTWMARCDAVVILIDKSTIEDSAWVAFESIITLWRRALDPDFIIIPVYLGTESKEGMEKQKLFKELNLKALEGVLQITSEGKRTPREMINCIKTCLKKKLKQYKGSTPIEKLEEQIEQYLKNVPNSDIKSVCCNLNIDPGPWKPKDHPHRALACWMLKEGLLKSTEALMESELSDLDDADKENIFNLVAPSWVDICAAGIIPDCAMNKYKPAIVLNAIAPFSAKMYIHRASCIPDGWQGNIYEVPNKNGAVKDEIPNEIVEWLTRTFADDFKDSGGLFPTPDAKRKELRRILADEKRPPIFIVFNYSELQKLLPELQKLLLEWQNHDILSLVTFFLLTGEKFPEQEKLEKLKFKLLEPPLQPHAEIDAYTENKQAYNRLFKKNQVKEIKKTKSRKKKSYNK